MVGVTRPNIPIKVKMKYRIKSKLMKVNKNESKAELILIHAASEIVVQRV